MTASDPTGSAPTGAGPVTVFWRPGCGFCGSLLRGLERDGVAFERRNIWEDEDAAAFVRSVADGNEVVPTVRVVDAALVNPSTGDVLRELEQRAPEHLPDGVEVPQVGRLGRAVTKLLGG
ncbi:MAG: glutaredoxin domain-containing protein [Nitriliruptor sp.]